MKTGPCPFPVNLAVVKISFFLLSRDPACYSSVEDKSVSALMYLLRRVSNKEKCGSRFLLRLLEWEGGFAVNIKEAAMIYQEKLYGDGIA